jgi:hypothetical protein
MQWQVIVALIVVIPVILIPVLFIWYLNIGGIYAAIKARQAAREQSRKVASGTGQHVAVTVNGESVKK